MRCSLLLYIFTLQYQVGQTPVTPFHYSVRLVRLTKTRRIQGVDRALNFHLYANPTFFEYRINFRCNINKHCICHNPKLDPYQLKIDWQIGLNVKNNKKNKNTQQKNPVRFTHVNMKFSFLVLLLEQITEHKSIKSATPSYKRKTAVCEWSSLVKQALQREI